VTTFTFGRVRVDVVPELDPVPYPAAQFFPDLSPDQVQAEVGWMAPRFFDPVHDHLYLSYHSWLVDTGRNRVLIDPCVGNHKNRPLLPEYDHLDGPWLDRLAAVGSSPDDIDLVVCTHLHADHCGWNTKLVDGRWEPTFPNARYLFSRLERDYWARDLSEAGSPELPAFNRGVFADSVLPVIEAGQALVFDGQLELTPDLTIEPTPGHTPGHVSVILDVGDSGMAFGGDVIHHPLQVRYPQLNTASCVDPVEARRQRANLLQRCADRRLLLGAAHFPEPHAFGVQSAGGGFRLLEGEAVLSG
jgi:glyoxylase-like metal-dependent hydrolase (beta-lactamase superfamily II)